MAIAAYGKRFSWEDSLFYHGYKKDKEESFVRILGHALPALRYRDPTTTPEFDFSFCSGVYLLHAPNGETVYVGQAKQLASRLIAHTGDHLRERWTHYSWFATSAGLDIAATEGVNVKDAEIEDASSTVATLSLNVLEAILRTAIEPRLNLQSGRWGNTPMYAQSLEYRFMYLREVYDQNKEIKKRLKKLSRGYE